MKAIITYICILIIIIGVYCLFSQRNTFEGYTTKDSQYAEMANMGMIGTQKNVSKAIQQGNKSVYGSNGIATKGYDADGSAIIDFNSAGIPIIGYKGNNPILGKVAPPPATNIPQLAAVDKITGFNVDGTPIFDNGIVTTSTINNPNISSPAPIAPVSTNPAVTQSGPLKRFNF
jgi:hypothetical protein